MRGRKDWDFPVVLGDILIWVLLHFCQRHWRDGTQKDCALKVGQLADDHVLRRRSPSENQSDFKVVLNRVWVMSQALDHVNPCPITSIHSSQLKSSQQGSSSG